MNEKKKIRVALIWGGRGRESEVSERGKNHILPLFDENTYRVMPIFIDKEGRFMISGREVIPHDRGFFCPEDNERYDVDCAIPLLHGDFGEDGRVQGALDCANISYVGCDSVAGAVCRDKAFVKTVADSLGIPTLPFILLLRDEGLDYAVRQAEEKFVYPMFVKPARLGSSVGACAAESRGQLASALTVAFTMAERVIIEPCLTHKRELECGYFSTKGKEIFTNPGEILHSGTYGYEEKYHSEEIGLAPRADIPEDVCQQIREYSRRLVRTLGIRQIARIDFFLTDGGLYFNEVNTMPGFTEGSLYARMLEGAGIDESRIFPLLIESVIGI